MKRKHKRLVVVVVTMALLGVASTLVLTAFEDNLVFFHSPSDILAGDIQDGRRIRVGGLVESGSVERNATTVAFGVTDMESVIPVSFTGLLPDLFREGQGVVVEGRMRDGMFEADNVLAKHDENYMPPEAAEALKRSGNWKHFEQAMRESGQVEKGAGQ